MFSLFLLFFFRPHLFYDRCDSLCLCQSDHAVPSHVVVETRVTVFVQKLCFTTPKENQ